MVNVDQTVCQPVWALRTTSMQISYWIQRLCRDHLCMYFYRHSLSVIPFPIIWPSLSFLRSICLSCYQSLYLGNYELDLNETWWKCWNLGPIDCIKISKRVISQRGKHFFCISMRFRAFQVDWDTLFFSENFREREAQNAREQVASVLVRLIVSKLHKKVILIYHIVL